MSELAAIASDAGATVRPHRDQYSHLVARARIRTVYRGLVRSQDMEPGEAQAKVWLAEQVAAFNEQPS